MPGRVCGFRSSRSRSRRPESQPLPQLEPELQLVPELGPEVQLLEPQSET